MSNEMFMFYRNSLIHNLCREYSDEFNKKLNDKAELVSLSLRQQSIPYFATACKQGWGLTTDYICNEFAEYINGRHTAKDCDCVEGYTYQLWCKSEEDCLVDCNVIHLMSCKNRVTIQKTKCPILYISNSSNITLNFEGYNSIMVYLFDDSNITINNNADDISVTIYKYSDECSVAILNADNNNNNKIKEFRKEIRL